MPKFRLSMDVLKLQSAKFTKALEAKLVAEFKRGGKEFARAALARIPVRTGFAAGSFGNLLDLVGSKGAISGGLGGALRRFKRSKTLARKEYYRHASGTRVLKTPTAGRRFATPTGRIIKVSGKRITFNYNVSIIYFRINNFYPSKSPTSPWRAIEAGRDAFNRYMETKGLQNLPNMYDYTTRSKIRVQ